MTALADAVREKAELTDTLTIDEMTEAVNGLVVNGIEVDERTLTVTPSKSQQNFTSSSLGENAYYGTVTVNAIPDEYITTADATASTFDILEGETAYVKGEKVTGRIKNYGDVTAKFSNIHNIWWSNAGYYHTIKVSITPKELTVTPSSQKQIFNVITEGDDVFYSKVTVDPIPSEYITTSDATAEKFDIIEGKTAYVNGEKVTGVYKEVTEEDVRWGVAFGAFDLYGGTSGFPETLMYRSGSFTGDATAEASDIAAGKIAYVKGQKITGTATGGADFYKCTAVFGPKTVTFLTVTGAGTEDCNGRYDEAGTKNGTTIYSYTSSSGTTWYIYCISSEYDGSGWVLADNTNVSFVFGGHYYAYSLSDSWYMGDAGASEPAPNVVKGSEVINASQPRIWSGYRIERKDDEYSIAQQISTELSYIDAYTPVVGKFYSADATIEVESFYKGFDVYRLFDADFSGGNTLPSKGTIYLEEDAAGTEDGILCTQSGYIRTNVQLEDIADGFTIITQVRPTENARFGLLAAQDSDLRIGVDTNGGTWNIWAGNGGWNILQADSGYSGNELDSSGRSEAQVKYGEFQTVIYTHSGTSWDLYVDGVHVLHKVREGRIAMGGNLTFNRWGNGGYIGQKVTYRKIQIFNHGFSKQELAVLY